MTKLPDSKEIAELTEIESILPAAMEVDNTPDFRDIPQRAQMILCLLACGWSCASVGSLIGVTAQAVHKTSVKYDPERKFTLSRTARRRFIARLWESRAGEALMRITPEKFKAATARDLADIAWKATRAAQTLQVEETPPKHSLQELRTVLASP